MHAWLFRKVFKRDRKRHLLDAAMQCSAIGSPETVRREIASFVERTGADELMLTGHIFDHQARLRSFEIGAEAMSREDRSSFAT